MIKTSPLYTYKVVLSDYTSTQSFVSEYASPEPRYAIEAAMKAADAVIKSALTSNVKVVAPNGIIIFDSVNY